MAGWSIERVCVRVEASGGGGLRACGNGDGSGCQSVVDRCRLRVTKSIGRARFEAKHGPGRARLEDRGLGRSIESMCCVGMPVRRPSRSVSIHQSLQERSVLGKRRMQTRKIARGLVWIRFARWIEFVAGMGQQRPASIDPNAQANQCSQAVARASAVVPLRAWAKQKRKKQSKSSPMHVEPLASRQPDLSRRAGSKRI